jgi:hypothetical protein
MAFYRAQTPGGIRLFVKSQKSTPKTMTFRAEQGSISKLGYLVSTLLFEFKASRTPSRQVWDSV